MGMLPSRNVIESRIEVLQRQLDRLNELPPEPDTGNGTVIYWRSSFGRDRKDKIYDYAAIRADDGKWYATGSHDLKGVSWEYLVQWIDNHATAIDGTIWVATQWEEM